MRTRTVRQRRGRPCGKLQARKWLAGLSHRRMHCTRMEKKEKGKQVRRLKQREGQIWTHSG